MMSGSADEAAGHAALVGRVAGGHVGRRVDRELVLGRHDRVRRGRGSPCSSSGYQTGNGTPKNRWRRDQPVAVEAADPVLVPDRHELGVELELGAAGEQAVAQVLVATAVADVPLAARDDLEGLVALLVEVRLALRRDGLAVQVARLAQAGDDRLARGEGGLAGELLVAGARPRRWSATPGCRAGCGRRGRRRTASAAAARATTARRSGRRTCSTSRCRRPCRARPAGGRGRGPRRRTAASGPWCRTGAGSARRRGAR